MATPAAGAPDPAALEALQAAVNALLPADTDGVRRPSQRRAGLAYWELGRLVDMHLGDGGAYGQAAVAGLAAQLGVLPRTLYRARKVHRLLPAATPALRQLTWSHCRLLVTVEDEARRAELARRAVDEGWSVRHLQAEVRAPADLPPRPARPGAVRVVDAGDGLALDLGFGVLRPLTCLATAGKRTRRLLPTLSPGDTVELSVDRKDRPALRRLWGHTDARRFSYPALDLQAVGSGQLRADLDLGLEVRWRGRCRLRSPADTLSRAQLAARIATTALPVLATSHRAGSSYELDLFGLPEAAPAARLATHGAHLNRVWSIPG